jgi:putative hydrolase of the HAD superfamily
VAIFGDIVTQHSSGFTRALPADKLAQLPVMLAQAHRAASRFRLAPYPGVEETLRQLHAKYRLAVVSDGQSAWAVPELHAVGLAGYFDPIVISGDFGYRKPDERLFSAALSAMNVAPSEALFVGNDTLRDVFGGHRLGMKTVFFESNQCSRDKDGVEPDYVIRAFPELLNAIRFFEGS